MTLQKMAQEYRANTALLELRVVQLEVRLRETKQLELRRRLKRRIGLLHGMIGEGNRAAYDLAVYYRKGAADATDRRCS